LLEHGVGAMSKIVGKPRSAFIDLHPAKPSPKPIAYKFRPAISEVKRVSLALQGGSAHGAFTWGVLDRLLEEPRIEVEGVSATSAGAMNAAVCPHKNIARTSRAIGGDDAEWPGWIFLRTRRRHESDYAEKCQTCANPIWQDLHLQTGRSVVS